MSPPNGLRVAMGRWEPVQSPVVIIVMIKIRKETPFTVSVPNPKPNPFRVWSLKHARLVLAINLLARL